MNRRNFFKAALLTTGAIIGYSTLAGAEERRRGARPSAGGGAAAVLVDPKDPAAKAVSYVHKTSDIKDAKLKNDRAGVKFADQKCSNCAFYLKDKETTVAGKKASGCQMPFATNKAVAAEGWCTSWAKKA